MVAAEEDEDEVEDVQSTRQRDIAGRMECVSTQAKRATIQPMGTSKMQLLKTEWEEVTGTAPDMSGSIYNICIILVTTFIIRM